MDLVRSFVVSSECDLLHNQLVRLPDPDVFASCIRELLRRQGELPEGASQAGEEQYFAIDSHSISSEEGKPQQGEEVILDASILH